MHMYVTPKMLDRSGFYMQNVVAPAPDFCSIISDTGWPLITRLSLPRGELALSSNANQVDLTALPSLERSVVCVWILETSQRPFVGREDERALLLFRVVDTRLAGVSHSSLPNPMESGVAQHHHRSGSASVAITDDPIRILGVGPPSHSGECSSHPVHIGPYRFVRRGQLSTLAPR